MQAAGSASSSQAWASTDSANTASRSTKKRCNLSGDTNRDSKSPQTRCIPTGEKCSQSLMQLLHASTPVILTIGLFRTTKPPSPSRRHICNGTRTSPSPTLTPRSSTSAPGAPWIHASSRRNHTTQHTSAAPAQSDNPTTRRRTTAAASQTCTAARTWRPSPSRSSGPRTARTTG